ncbi:MAG: Spy/CpxP family protein refolding chaperone [Vicinamibacteria bacterium]|nr:Spy/CpxP family protein refolding chaperone [Vicinamibacteria bacterium]
MRFKSTLVTVLLAVLVSSAVTYGVHAWRNPVEASSDDPFAVLDLSADQKEKIHQIAMAHHPSLLARQAAVDAKRQELAALLAAPDVLDEAAVERSLQEVARLESELDQEVARNLIELRPLLTEEQQRTLFQHIELRHPRNPRPNGGRP